MLGCGSSDTPAPGDAGTTADAVSDVAEGGAPDAPADTAPIDATHDTSDAGVDAGPLPSCLGDALPVVLAANLPFVDVTVDGTSTGKFLVDYATTGSAIDLSAFTPAPAATGCDASKLGQSCAFADFDFFGSWGSVHLVTEDLSGFTSLRQAGIVGTDFLSVHAFTLDYTGKRLFRAKKSDFCTDTQLSSAGFRAMSSSGFFANDLGALKPLSDVVSGAAPGLHVPNVPTVPVRIAGSDAIAQLDTGFADSLVPFSINVNVAWFDAISAAAPAALVRASSKDLVLSTCVSGVNENVEAYTLASGVALQMMGASGPLHAFGDAIVFVKRTPPSASSCGGIGTWTAPAAQMGASFFVELGVMLFDPFGQRVWIR